MALYSAHYIATTDRPPNNVSPKYNKHRYTSSQLSNTIPHKTQTTPHAYPTLLALLEHHSAQSIDFVTKLDHQTATNRRHGNTLCKALSQRLRTLITSYRTLYRKNKGLHHSAPPPCRTSRRPRNTLS